MKRILVAGVGNVLRGDDAFGIEVLRELQRQPEQPGVEFFESGIAGISLVQKLMDGFDALVIIDALDRDAAPGKFFVLEIDGSALNAIPAEVIDLHQADPSGVLRMANSLGVLPARAWILGCQAVGCDELGAALSESVARAVPVAVGRVREIVEGLLGNAMADNLSSCEPEEDIAAKDELLQVMYWLRGEHLAEDFSADDLARWVGKETMDIHSLLVELAEARLLKVVDDSVAKNAIRFRLTSSGVKEGGRRFADEFSEMTKPGHYECSDPNCECRQTGNPADCVHQR